MQFLRQYYPGFFSSHFGPPSIAATGSCGRQSGLRAFLDQPAFKLGEKTGNPLLMYMVDAFTLPANLAGVPAISVPGGFSPEGLPLGLQLMATHFAEAELLRAAHAFEGATEHHRRRPKLD